MSAAEIIEQIKTLPPADCDAVASFVAALRERNTRATPPAPEPIEAIAERIFNRYDELFRKLAE